MAEAALYPAGQQIPGTVYRVVRHLATGGMGSVYDVEDVTVEKRYVLKTLHPQLIAREDLAKRMRDEAKILAKLSHPNIVDVVTAGVTQDGLRMPFYVMERLNGQNLRIILEKKGALELPHAFRIAIDVLDALEHAHENHIIHRDVKPENIFLHRNATGTTTTKLLDFGIMRLLDRKASHTQGKFIGTLRYASPEQISGGDLGPGTDIYSLGIVLYEMLTGRGPFDGAGDAYAVGAAHVRQTPPPVSQFSRVPPEVERLVMSALAKTPTERPRDCFAFASELRRLLREEQETPRSATAVNVLSIAGTAPNEASTVNERGANEPDVALAATVGAQGYVRSASGGEGLVGATHAGMPAPSAIAPTMREAGYAPPSGVGTAPTVANAAAARRPVDRDAPTRASAPTGHTQRLPSNETHVDYPAHGARAVSVSGVSGEGAVVFDELVFPSSQPGGTTGPTAGEAATRAPDRGVVLPIALAAFASFTIIGGALLFVVRPWTQRGSAHARTSAPASAVTSATPSASASASVAAPRPRASGVLSAEPTVGLASSGAAPSAAVGVARPPSVTPAIPAATALPAVQKRDPAKRDGQPKKDAPARTDRPDRRPPRPEDVGFE